VSGQARTESARKRAIALLEEETGTRLRHGPPDQLTA
jgi:hypothetical protein